MENERFITAEELAAMLDVSVHTTRVWRRTGKGPPFYRIGRIRYRYSEVTAWIESCKQGS